MEKKNKNYFTRKNLIAISLVALYSFLTLFVGACIEGNHNFFVEDNPIALLAKGFKFSVIACGLSGAIALVLMALYIIVGFVAILYIYRYAKVNNIKFRSPKIVLAIVLTVLFCLLLSIGIGVIIQRPLNASNIGTLFNFLGQCLFLALIIYLIAFCLLGSIVMLVVNFINIDKEFKSFKHNELPDFDDEDLIKSDVSQNFEPLANQETSNVGVSSGIGNISSTSIKEEYNPKALELDDREKVFPSLSKLDVEYDGYSIESIESTDINLFDLCNQFRLYLAKTEELYFDIDTIRFFIAGLATSHFMILEGLSGTGKSSLPRYFARFTNSNLQFVAVQATYRDKSSLLGYFNEFSKTYSETDFLLSLYGANYNPDRLYFFVLDEMNISRVEYYFADFLSILEYPESEWKLRLMHLPYDFIPPAKLDDGIIQIPNNSYFIGTANKDDSTFTITNKVYDRAITIDFDERNIPFEVKEDVNEIVLSKTKFASLVNDARSDMVKHLNVDDYDKFNSITNYINEEFDLTFGNRVLNQIEELVPVYVACGGTKETALDFLLSHKIISKLEGRFEDYVKDGLKSLDSLIVKTYGKDVFVRSQKLINSLIRKL